MDHRDKILNIVQEKGPLLPAQINRELKTNVLFASAMLSEMVDQKKLKLSSVKIGGSPLYYCEGQESKLAEFADKLSEPARTAFNSLKSSKILRDRSQEPHLRVALREINDFAIPLEVNADGYSDLFWKYYQVSDSDAETLIKDYINEKATKKSSMIKDVTEESSSSESKEVQSTISSEESTPAIQSTTESVNSKQDESKPQEPVQVSEPVHPKAPVSSVSMTTLEESEVPEFSYEPSFSFSTTIDTEEKVTLEKKKEPEPEPEPEMPEFPEDDEFFNKIKNYFDESGIEINDFELIRKSSEYDFVIELPSNVGMLNYYCKAKSKAKINDGDLSSAFVQGLIKKLPILFITTGDLTKRAEELLTQEFKNMFVKNLD